MSVQREHTTKRFDEELEWLESLRPRGISLGLDRVRCALERLGSPQKELQCVIVAGTNGKGSTANFIASIAHAAGYRVGLYTSPHLVDVTERIVVGGTPISRDAFIHWSERLRQVMVAGDGGANIKLTYFEALTVMAFCHFHHTEVDLAVLEVGLGGRLDATAVAAPLVSVITPIGLDHQAFLGDTLEEIATEKAGIIKDGATVVTNVSDALFHEVVGPKAFEHRSPIRRSGVDFLYQELHGGLRYRGWIHRVGPVVLGLLGTHQADNGALACAAIESLCAHGFSFKAYHLAEGLMRARHPGRLERREPCIDADGEAWPAILLDGAHNPMGAEALGREVSDALPERPRIGVFSARPDKDVEGLLTPVLGHLDAIIITQLEGEPPVESGVVEQATSRAGCPTEWVEAPRAALERAKRLTGHQGGVLVFGSLYLIGALSPQLAHRVSHLP